MKLSNQEIMFYERYKEELFRRLNKQKTKDGLFIASNHENYNASWFRDNAIIALSYLKNDPKTFELCMHTHLDLFKKFERKYNKFSSMINFPSTENWRFLHAKINPYTLDEIEGLGNAWNHQQSEYMGMILLNIVYGVKEGLNIIRDDSDRGMIQLLVDYTVTIQPMPNCSSWEEENRDLRTSTSALILKGLKEIKKLGFFVPDYAITRGEELLKKTFPHETSDRQHDLVLLYLPFYNITDNLDSKYIVKGYEIELLGNRNYGIRYKRDVYYANENGEMEWTFSRAYLSYIYKKLGYDIVAKIHLDKIINDFPDGEIPEGVYSGTLDKNDNSFLSWSASMTIVAIDALLDNEYSLINILI